MGIKKSIKEKQNSQKATTDVLVKKIPLRLNHDQVDLVNRLRRESASVWNKVLDIHWFFWGAYGVWLNETQLKGFLKGAKFSLHSQTTQAVIELHQETCERTREQRNNGNLDWKYPWRQKKFFSIRYKKSAIYEQGNCVKFSNGRNEEPLLIKKPKSIDFSKIRSAEIVWSGNQYWLHLTVEHPKQTKVQGNSIAAGDPGEVHALTLSDGKNHLIITGKELRSLHRHRNKVLAQLQKAISKKKRGSKSFHKLVRRKRNFLAKISRKIDYVEHCISKMAIDWCFENGIKTIYIGDPEGVQRNTSKSKRKLLNQKLSNWSFGELFRKLEYKGKLFGIAVKRIEESYTSGTCPVCEYFHKQTGRTFKCPKCGATGHRDVVGAINILNKAVSGELTKGRRIPKFEEVKYRQVLVQPHKELRRSAPDRATQQQEVA